MKAEKTPTEETPQEQGQQEEPETVAAPETPEPPKEAEKIQDIDL